MPLAEGSITDRRADAAAKVACRTCTHPKDAHEHHRRGSDCSQSGCGCLEWKRPAGRLGTLFKH